MIKLKKVKLHLFLNNKIFNKNKIKIKNKNKNKKQFFKNIIKIYLIFYYIIL